MVFNNNLNFLLLRTKPYNPIGRHQSEEESDALKQPMVQLLKERGISYIEVDGDIVGYDKIIEEIKKNLFFLTIFLQSFKNNILI